MASFISAPFRPVHGRSFVVLRPRARYYPGGEDALLMTHDPKLQPVRSAPLSADVEVLENVAEGGENHRLALAIPDWPGAEPGQFLMLSSAVRRDAERTDPLLPRPMAVFAQEPLASSASRVEVLYKASGRGTRLLAQARPGEALRILGPLGGSFPVQAQGERALLVGGGTGIASLYELAARCAESGSVDVVLGARTETDLMGVSRFEKLDVNLHLTTEDGGRGHSGRVTDVLPRLFGDSPQAISLYACGPTPMMRACADLAVQAGLNRCWVSLENTMACGFGVCLGCAIPLSSGGFSLLCRLGPVYPAAEIEWERLP